MLGENVIYVNTHGQKQAAKVVKVWSPHCVNVVAWNEEGSASASTSVTLDKTQSSPHSFHFPGPAATKEKPEPKPPAPAEVLTPDGSKIFSSGNPAVNDPASTPPSHANIIEAAITAAAPSSPPADPEQPKQ